MRLFDLHDNPRIIPHILELVTTIEKDMNSCSTKSMTSSDRKKRFQVKRLAMLNFIKDAIERRLAAVNATIEKLEEQIDREANI